MPDNPPMPGYAERYADRVAFCQTLLREGMTPGEWQTILTYRATGELSSGPPPDEYYEERGEATNDQA